MSNTQIKSGRSNTKEALLAKEIYQKRNNVSQGRQIIKSLNYSRSHLIDHSPSIDPKEIWENILDSKVKILQDQNMKSIVFFWPIKHTEKLQFLVHKKEDLINHVKLL